jgi:chromosomal replication initiation ATPase DnaA
MIISLQNNYNGNMVSTNRLNEAEVQSLLKNIVDILKHYTLPELNDYLLSAVNKKEDTHDAEKYIINLVCETYNVSYRSLIYSRSNQSITKARQVAFCLLHFTLGLSTRYIAKRVFKLKYHNTVGSAIKMYKNLNPNMKLDREFKQTVETLKEKVISKLKNIEK